MKPHIKKCRTANYWECVGDESLMRGSLTYFGATPKEAYLNWYHAKNWKGL